MVRYDAAVINGKVVIPYTGSLTCDVGIQNGKVVALSDKIAPADAQHVIDARGKIVLPGAVDSHFHIGIYRPLSEDARSETASALVGGVTTVLSYFRTGQHYLNKSGPYREIFPEVLASTQGQAYTDYGYHIAIMTSQQLGEVDWLIADQGVASFKYYMFYKGLNLTSDSTQANAYTMADNYDLSHLYLLMQEITRAAHRHGKWGRISLSIHCEQSELLRLGIEDVKKRGIEGLQAYNEARTTLSETLAITEALHLAGATSCPVNLLHLSSGAALAAAIEGRRRYPHLDIQLETTLHHLALTCDTGGGILGKVNPPIRGSEDRNALWEGVLHGDINTVASDHAACSREDKTHGLWSSLPGFGGTSLIYPILLSEGYHRRGVPLTRVVELASANPAKNFGLYPKKGTIAVGSDADLTIVDLEKEQTVTPDLLLSSQDFTPFQGIKLRGWPVQTLLGGQLVYNNSRVVGNPSGKYLKRPVALHPGR